MKAFQTWPPVSSNPYAMFASHVSVILSVVINSIIFVFYILLFMLY